MFLNTKKIIFTLIICLVFSSCSTKEENLVEVNSDYINNQILIRIAGFANTFKTVDPIFLELKYNTSNEIVFPNNYNLRLFYQEKDKWIEIKEKPTQRYPEGDIIFSPKISMPIVESVVVFPDLPDLNEEYTLRIYVIGEMNIKERKELVAAYTEIKLSP